LSQGTVSAKLMKEVDKYRYAEIKLSIGGNEKV
jgi:hypothetical protein